jgi:signal peptidase
MRRAALQAGAVLAIAVALASIRMAGYTPYVVASGSMEPTVPAGSVIVVQAIAPEGVRVGDVITFTLPDRIVTHRVTSIATTDLGTTFTTRGDANTATDPWLVRPNGDVGAVRLTIPFLGFVVATTQAWWRLVAVLLLAWLAVEAVVRRLRHDGQRRHVPQAATP